MITDTDPKLCYLGTRRRVAVTAGEPREIRNVTHFEDGNQITTNPAPSKYRHVAS